MLTVSVLSHVPFSATPGTTAHQAPLSLGILQARILEWVCHALLQGIFPTQGSNCLNHQGSPYCIYSSTLPGCPLKYFNFEMSCMYMVKIIFHTESFRMKSLSFSRGKHIFEIFIYLFLAALGLGCWVWASSSCGERRVERLLSSCHVQVPHCHAFSCGRAQALGTKVAIAVAHRLSCSRHVGSSWPKDWTPVSCIGRQILYQRATGKSQRQAFLPFLFFQANKGVSWSSFQRVALV